MGNYAQWAAGAVIVALVLWLIVTLYKNHQAWEQERRDRKAMEEETAYWREVAENAARRAKQLDILTQNVEAVTPSMRELQNQSYEQAKAKAFERRQSDLLDKGAGVPLPVIDPDCWKGSDHAVEFLSEDDWIVSKWKD